MPGILSLYLLHVAIVQETDRPCVEQATLAAQQMDVRLSGGDEATDLRQPSPQRAANGGKSATNGGVATFELPPLGSAPHSPEKQASTRPASAQSLCLPFDGNVSTSTLSARASCMLRCALMELIARWFSSIEWCAVHCSAGVPCQQF